MKSLIKRPVLFNNFFSRPYLGQQILLIFLLLGIVSGVFLGLTPDAGLDDQRGTASGANLEIAPVLKLHDQADSYQR